MLYFGEMEWLLEHFKFDKSKTAVEHSRVRNDKYSAEYYTMADNKQKVTIAIYYTPENSLEYNRTLRYLEFSTQKAFEVNLDEYMGKPSMDAFIPKLDKHYILQAQFYKLYDELLSKASWIKSIYNPNGVYDATTLSPVVFSIKQWCKTLLDICEKIEEEISND